MVVRRRTIRHSLHNLCIGIFIGVIVAYAALASFGAVELLLAQWRPGDDLFSVGFRGLHISWLIIPILAGLAIGALLSWLARMGISMRISGEFDDSALLQAFGSEGHGFFFAPSAIRDEICAKYDVQCIGEVTELVQEFYAVSAERKISHKAVKLITDNVTAALIGPAAAGGNPQN